MKRRKLTAFIALATAACHGWRIENGPLPKSGVDQTTAVRVSLKSGGDVFMVSPTVQGDSLVGYTRDNRADFARVAVAVTNVREVATYGFDGVKTAVVVLVAVGSALTLVALCAASIGNA